MTRLVPRLHLRTSGGYANVSWRNGEWRTRLGVRKVETKSQRDPLSRACPFRPQFLSTPSRSLAPSCLAQMKFSATLHSNAIKARIASWCPAEADGEPSGAEPRLRGSSSPLSSFSPHSAAETSTPAPPSSISRNRIVTCSRRGTLRDRSTRDSSPNAKRAG